MLPKINRKPNFCGKQEFLLCTQCLTSGIVDDADGLFDAVLGRIEHQAASEAHYRALNAKSGANVETGSVGATAPSTPSPL